MGTHSNLVLGSLPFSTGIGPITSSVAIDKSLHNCVLHMPRFCIWSLRGIIRENDCAVCQGLKRKLPKQKTPQKTSFAKDFHSAVQIFLPELPKRGRFLESIFRLSGPRGKRGLELSFS
jgi:hypothetical protein